MKLIFRLKRIVISIIAITLTIYLGVIAYAMWDMRSIEVSFFIEANQYITEELALDLSKKSLVEVTGKPESNFSPEYFRSKNEGYFARNSYQQENGYVLWRDNSSNIMSRRFDYSVSLIKKGNEVIASVGKTK